MVTAYEKKRQTLVACIDGVEQKMLSKDHLVTLVGSGHRCTQVLLAPVRTTPPIRCDGRHYDGLLPRQLASVAQSVAGRLTCPQSSEGLQ
jgi:hypothetical protein